MSRIRPGTASLVKIQGGLCAYCAEPFHGRGKHPLAPSLDHVWPRCYGRTRVGNVLAVHYVCNHRKGRRKPNGCEQVMLDAINHGRVPGCAGMSPGASGMEARQGGDVEQAPSEGRQPARTPTTYRGGRQ
jgi:hypothetical protein